MSTLWAKSRPQLSLDKLPKQRSSIEIDRFNKSHEQDEIEFEKSGVRNH
jgi:hypothetical protein